MGTTHQVYAKTIEKTDVSGNCGKVAERLKALLSKSSEGQLSESSNLSLSAMVNPVHA